MATIAAIGGLALGAYGAWRGHKDKQDAKDQIAKANKNRAEYDIPTSIQEQLELLRRRSQTGLPGEDLIAGQIQQGTAQGISASREAATSAADLLGATTNLYSNQTQALTNLQIESARQRAANELAYAQGLNTMAQYADKAFNWDEAVPWQVKQNVAQNQLQSAYDMQMSGINNILYAGSSLYDSINLNNNNNNNNPIYPKYMDYNYYSQVPYDTSQLPAEKQGTPITLNQSGNNFNWNSYPG